VDSDERGKGKYQKTLPPGEMMPENEGFINTPWKTDISKQTT